MKNEIELKLLQGSNNYQRAIHQEDHIQVGEFVKSFVYGALDGTINILIIIITAVFCKLSPHKLLIIAGATTIGDALGMGLGDFLSFRSEQAYIQLERGRQEYQFDNMRQQEIHQLVVMFNQKGYDSGDSKTLSNLYSSNRKIFVDIMMMMELGLVVNDVQPWKVGLTNFCSFLFSGVLPILPFILDPIGENNRHRLFITLVIGGIQLFSLGYIKGKIIQATPQKKRQSGIQFLLFGVVAVVVGYIVGSLFEH